LPSFLARRTRTSASTSGAGKCHLTPQCKTCRVRWRHDFPRTTFVQNCIYFAWFWSWEIPVVKCDDLESGHNEIISIVLKASSPPMLHYALGMDFPIHTRNTWKILIILSRKENLLWNRVLFSLRVNYFSTIDLWAIKIKFSIARMKF